MGSDFLTLNEQNLFLAFSKDKLPPVSMEMCGGYELAERKIIFYKPVGVGGGIPGSYLFIIGSAFNEEVFRRTDTQGLSGCTYESWYFKNKNRRYNRAG